MSDKAIRDYLEGLMGNSSGQTKQVRLYWADRWLAFMNGKPLHEWDKMQVTAFRTMLENEKDAEGDFKYKASTVRMALLVVKRCFDAAIAVHEKERLRINREIREKRNRIDVYSSSALTEMMKLSMEADDINSTPGPQWDVGKRWLPDIQRSEQDHPAMPMENLKKLIEAAKKGQFEPDDVAYLALASIYGLRKGELIKVRPEHINYDKGTIWIDTEKHGEKRDQILSKTIVPYLKKCDFETDYTSYYMGAMFIKMCHKAGIELSAREGWHAIRRRLETAIIDSLSSDPHLNRQADRLSQIWFRWKPQSIQDVYYAADEADRIVLAHHPVVNFWR